MKPRRDRKKKTRADNTCYNKLPTRVSRKDFNRFVKPYLSRGRRGPDPKISSYKIFNYILYVLHTGMQWKALRTCRNEISWQTIYHHHSRWSKDGSYERLFKASVERLDEHGKLDLSILHDDGSNTVAKKGAKKSATPDTNIKKAKKSLP